MFAVMKQILLLAGMVASLACGPIALFAQDSPAAAAEREEILANYKRINTKIEQLEDTLQSLQKQMGTLSSAIHSLRGEVDQLKSRNENAATQDAIKRLADKIEEVDKKRQADNELVRSQFKTLGRELSKSVAPRDSAPPPPKTDRATEPPDSSKTVAPENLLAYKIKDGDTLVRIVADLRAQGFKVSQQQVMDVNPKVIWNRLAIGQTIYIPKP
jgi:septal ring factor EnvC (AmiA/AmiB activator)